MRRLLVICLLAVSSFGQNSPQWRSAADVAEGARGSIAGTVVDIDEGASRLQITTDEDRFSRITVLTDSVTTQYNGFGGVINGQPEIFIGSKGFSNVRLGDRVEVRGIGRGNHALGADIITLLGRSVPASQTGVGETRSPSSISTPTNAPPSSDVTVYGRVEGVVRQVNADEGRVTIETDRREMITVRATRNTPVYYRGQTYQISNLEAGDRVRIEPQSTSTTGGEVSARSMEVIRSVQEGSGAPRSVTQLSGRVTRVDSASTTITIDTGRGAVRVDLTNAYDETGARVRPRDLQTGDRVTVIGSFGSSTDLFLATTVRFADTTGGGGAPVPPQPAPAPSTLGVVSVWGTVAESLKNGPMLVVRESKTGAEYRVNVTDDFVVKTKAGAYTTADRLKEGDAVAVKAYRDTDGNYIAQTIRIR